MSGEDATGRGVEGLPYRPCVGLMVLNPAGLVFAGQRLDAPEYANAWQMPQGGIDAGETPREAALRELGEETGIARDRVRLLRESARWIPYELPPELVGRLWGGQYRGQTQRWFALEFLGRDDEIDIDTEHREFARWAWMPHAELAGRIVPFKRATYAAVFDEFADLLGG